MIPSARVVVAGDIRLYREGLVALLGRDERFAVVGSAANPQVALDTVASVDPDVLLIDMAMQDALDAVRTISRSHPQVKIVALTLKETEKDVCACAEAGVAGFVPRSGSFDDLVGTLEGLARGELHCSARAAAALLQRVTTLATERPRISGGIHLTPRELEVLELIEQGLSNKEIATSLGIEVATAKNHVHNILEKMNVHRRGEAASRMRRRRLRARSPELSASQANIT